MSLKNIHLKVWPPKGQRKVGIKVLEGSKKFENGCKWNYEQIKIEDQSKWIQSSQFAFCSSLILYNSNQ